MNERRSAPRPAEFRRDEHLVARRRFLQGTVAAGATLAAGGLAAAPVAETIERRRKHVIFLFMMGGASQFETWDPKPGQPTAGPYRAIQTKLPGVLFNEYMPGLARLADKVSVVRTLEGGAHESGNTHKATGHSESEARKRGVTYPFMGSVVSHELNHRDPSVPKSVVLTWAVNPVKGYGEGLKPGFLGPEFAPVDCPGNGELPPNIARNPSISAEAFAARDELRSELSRRFGAGRPQDYLGSYDAAYGQVPGMLRWKHLFDLSQEPEKVRARYGPTRIGRDCLTARRLVEAGCPFVYVQCYPGNLWDLHHGLVLIQRRLTSTFDAVTSTLIEDLIERGLWDDTLLVCVGEMGRTPLINRQGGRDHWSVNESMMIGGCGIRGGQIIGETDAQGKTIKDRKVSVADLHHTCYEALGIDRSKEFEIAGQPIPMLGEGDVIQGLL